MPDLSGNAPAEPGEPQAVVSAEMPATAADIRIVRLVEMPSPDHCLPGIERILFETARRAFQPGPERDAFVERWLGRFLKQDLAHAFVAIDPAGAVVGYVIGALDDPAQAERFRDLSYFQDFAGLTPLYPAHLHINLTERWRSFGIGERLIEAFCLHAKAAGASGVHVVTGEGARNVRFYARCGFRQVSVLDWNGHRIVFLARSLGDAS